MRHPLIDVPELVRLRSGDGIVRIPNEIDVPFTARVRRIVDTPQFQRLRHISQLGLVSLVYPGATHSRFEHVLGVFHNAIRYLWQLGKDPRFGERITRRHAETLMVAALLHDLGHWPFCHPIEDMGLSDLPAHESLAAEFLTPGTELEQVLREDWELTPQEVLEILQPQSDSVELRLLRSILSGPIDIDKMDYLERDSLHCGVPYGRNFDKHRLIQSLQLNAAGDGLAISSKGKTAAELMVFARYVMFSEVYWHHTVRSATAMFARAFYELRPRMEIQSVFRMSEQELIRTLRELAAGTVCEPLIEGLFGPTRMIYKRVLECTPYQSPELYERLARRPFAALAEYANHLADRLSTVLQQPVHATDLVFDAPPPQREIQFQVEIHDLKMDTYRPLDVVSPVVSSLAREQFDDYVKRVRLFVHPRLRTPLRSLPDLPQLIAELLGRDPNPATP